MLVLVKKDFSLKDILKSYEDPGRKKGRPSGSHVDDLVALKKALILCGNCIHKFDAKRSRYSEPRRFATVRSKCDDCRQFGFGTLFLPEDHVEVIGNG